jgi:PAS domain S-box-containing protein
VQDVVVIDTHRFLCYHLCVFKKMMFLSTLNLKTKITVMVLLLFLCSIWVLTFFISKRVEQEMTAQLETQQFSTVSYIADSIENQVKLRIHSLAAIAKIITPELMANPGKLKEFLQVRPLLATLFQTGVLVISREGIGIADYPVLPGRVGRSFLEREYFKEVVATGRPAIGKPRIGPFSKKPVVGFAVPVLTSSGKIIAVLAGFTLLTDPALLGSFENLAYKDFLDRLTLVSPQYRLIITGSDPTRILTPTPETGVNPLFDRFMTGFEGSGVAVNSRGIRLLLSAKRIPTPGWFVRLGLPTEITFAPIRSIKNWSYSIALGLSLLSSLLAWLIIRQALRPLYAATKLIKDITGERLPPQNIPITQYDEVGQLLASFNAHLNYRKQAEEELRLHSEIMNNMAEGIYLIRLADGIIVFANPKFEKMFGYGPGEMIGEDVSIVNAPTNETPEETKAAIMDILSRTGEWHGEVENIRKDGTHFWCYANVSLIDHPEHGRVIISVHTDITERKQAEEQLERSFKEKTVMLQEIHHRVKNNMAVIIGLLRLQAKGIADESVRAKFEESQNRVYSMALIHETLYRSADLAHIDFKEYMKNLGGGIADTYKRHDVIISVDMEPVAIDVNVGIPCGLIVNELVSNSLKHAFPEGRMGTIRVGISIDSEGNHVLFVEDNGIGLPEEVDFRNTLSLGLQLVNGLTQQISGKIELSREGGTRFRITFRGAPDSEGKQNG